MRTWIVRCVRVDDSRCRVTSALGLALLLGSLLYGQLVVAERPKEAGWALCAPCSQGEDLTLYVVPALEAEREAGTGRDLAIEAAFSGQVSLETLADVARVKNAKHLIVIVDETAPVPTNQ